MAVIQRISRALVDGRSGQWRLGAASFLESTIVPIPLEVLVIPLMAGHPKRAFFIANAIFVGCLLGAFSFYWIGHLLLEPVVMPALSALGLADSYRSAERALAGENLFWAVFLVSVSPVPFQLATLSAGALDGNFVLFMLAVAASRAIRYYGLAILAATFGERILHVAGSRQRLIVGFLALLAVGWLIGQMFA